jgi:prepilin-type N-terminal cleavage/methylation domain-containing protein
VSNKSPRAFSLIEVMVAAAIVGLVAGGVVQTLRFVADANAASRTRALAALEARATLDRVMLLRASARSVGSSDTQTCALLESAGGPMDATGSGTTASGTCPFRKVEAIPTSSPGLVRSVEIVNEPFGRANALRIKVAVATRTGRSLLGSTSVTVEGVIRP